MSCSDSAACLFDLPALLVSLFLIGSNALLLLMVGLFIHQPSIIREEAHLETEYAPAGEQPFPADPAH